MDLSGRRLPEIVPVFSRWWSDSGYKFASSTVFFCISAQCLDRQWIQICVSLRCSAFRAIFRITTECLVRQWIQISVSLRSSFVLQPNAWFVSGYNLRQSAELFRISVQCLVRQWIHIAALVVVFAVAWLAIAGMLFTMLSRCVHFVVGRPMESPQEQPQRQVPAASFASWDEDN